jgi:hypothetical protein
MQNVKAAQRQRIIYEFGILVQPFVDLAKRNSPPPISDYRLAVAKVYSGDSEWRKGVREFTTLASDIFLNDEYQRLSHVPERCRRKLADALNNTYWQDHLQSLHEQFQRHVGELEKEFFDCLDQVPIDWGPVVFGANTPFTAYLKIKEVLAVVNERLHYFDSYLKPEFFDLFLRSVNRDLSVRLVTTTGTKDYGVQSVNAVSQLACKEFTDYQLIEVDASKVHDRNLRIDNRIFSLGPGVDRAGIALTNFGPSEDSQAAQVAFDKIIADGRIVHES